MPEGGARHYDDDEVEAILRRALERQLEAGNKLGHDDLIAAAREVGLDDDAVAHAIGEIEAERSAASIRVRLRRKRRDAWIRHVVTYLSIAAALFALNAFGLVGLWILWIPIVWGVFVALHTYRGLRQTTDEEVEREQHRLNRLARRKAKAEARREAKRRHAEARAQREHARRARGETASDIERVIEEGVSLLLNAAANKLREANEGMQPRAPRTDFERYVASKKAGARGDVAQRPEKKAPREAPRVRVDAEVDELEERLEEELERALDRSSRKR